MPYQNLIGLWYALGLIQTLSKGWPHEQDTLMVERFSLVMVTMEIDNRGAI